MNGGAVEIPLSQGQITLIDAADYDLVARYRTWHAYRAPKTFYARTNVKVLGKYRQVRMHTVIFGALFVDHINNDGLDNRRSNLRAATESQNCMNRTMRSDNTSGFRGVYFGRTDKRWHAQITCARRQLHLGAFATPEEAAAAYDAAAIDLFGEFARPNLAESR